MRDYEELVKELREKAERFDYDGWVETAIYLEKIADAIEELVAKVPKWISVEERLPGKDDMVFFYYEWVGQSGTVYKEVSLSTLGEIQHFGFKMIAWMPLPAPPKEDAV